MFTDWPRSGSYTNYKTPTVALLNPDETLKSFGSEAIDDYHELNPTEQRQLFFFENFKMDLYKNLAEVTCHCESSIISMFVSNFHRTGNVSLTSDTVVCEINSAISVCLFPRYFEKS